MAYRKRNFRLYDAEHLTEALKEAGVFGTFDTVANANIDEDGFFIYNDGEHDRILSAEKIAEIIFGEESVYTNHESVDGPDGEHLLAMWAL